MISRGPLDARFSWWHSLLNPKAMCRLQLRKFTRARGNRFYLTLNPPKSIPPPPPTQPEPLLTQIKPPYLFFISSRIVTAKKSTFMSLTKHYPNEKNGYKSVSPIIIMGVSTMFPNTDITVDYMTWMLIWKLLACNAPFIHIITNVQRECSVNVIIFRFVFILVCSGRQSCTF